MLDRWVSFCRYSVMTSRCSFADCIFLLAGLSIALGSTPMQKPLSILLSICSLQNPCPDEIDSAVPGR